MYSQIQNKALCLYNRQRQKGGLMDRREALKPGTELSFADNSNKATYTIVRPPG